MSIDASERQVVDNLFKAMQMGPGGEELMMSLFAEDAVLVEPFSGEPRIHEGFEAVREAFRDSWKDEPPPDMKLILDRADRDGELVRADWTCTSPAFPAPMKGYDLFTIRDGKIERLEVIVKS